MNPYLPFEYLPFIWLDNLEGGYLLIMLTALVSCERIPPLHNGATLYSICFYSGVVQVCIGDGNKLIPPKIETDYILTKLSKKQLKLISEYIEITESEDAQCNQAPNCGD
jgi:hypothetical protein